MSHAMQSGTNGLEKSLLFVHEHAADAASLMPERGEMRKRVLQISDDISLANSRRLILRRAGFLVETKTRREFWAEVDQLNCDVIVLCQTISPGEAHAIAMAVQTHKPAPPIVRFWNREELSADAFQYLLQAPAPPESMCLAIRSAIAAN